MKMSRHKEPIKPIIFLAPVGLRNEINAAAKDTGECMSVWIRDAIRAKLAAAHAGSAFNPARSDDLVAA